LYTADGAQRVCSVPLGIAVPKRSAKDVVVEVHQKMPIGQPIELEEIAHVAAFLVFGQRVVGYD
jgi:hypothetical protein